MGVNRYTEEAEDPIEIFYPDEEGWERERVSYLARFRKNRDSSRTKKALEGVRKKMGTDENMIPTIMEAVTSGATMGEIHDAMREAIGFTFEY